MTGAKRSFVDPENLTSDEQAQAEQLFGTSSQANRYYANWANRRRLVQTYFFTDPAVVATALQSYRFTRDTNLPHFVLERLYQLATAREGGTQETVSRSGAAMELALLALTAKGISFGLNRAVYGGPRVATEGERLVESVLVSQRTSSVSAGSREAAAVSSAPLQSRPSRKISGETIDTAQGKSVHKKLANERRASGEFDLVNEAIPDGAGNPIQVPKRVNLKTGEAVEARGSQTAHPDAVDFGRRLILDDKPLGRDVFKDRQEIIRFMRAYEAREGVLPETIAIQRYDPVTGMPVRTDLYSPQDFLPKVKK